MSDGMTSPILSPDDIVQEFKDLYATNLFGVASFVVLVYDHMLTFDDEVEFIWKAKWSKVSFFFLLNRYLIPLGFIVNLVAYFSPAWTSTICHHFVRYEGAMTMIGLSIAGIIMGLRVSALYHRNYFVKILLASILLSFIGINAWLLTSGIAVSHPGIHGCTMIFGPQVGNWASASAWIPLLYDTTVVFLVIIRATPFIKVSVVKQDVLVKRVLRDGLIYFSVVTAASLVLTIMIETAPPGIRNICAQFQLLITVTMISRVTLNLRKHLQESNAQILPSVNPRTSTFKSTAQTTDTSAASSESTEAPYTLSIRHQEFVIVV